MAMYEIKFKIRVFFPIKSPRIPQMIITKVHVNDSNEHHIVYSVSAKNLPHISMTKINSY